MRLHATGRSGRWAALLAATALGATGLGLAAPASAGTGAAPTEPADPPALVNPGFEAGLDGWTVTGTAGAAKTESAAHRGELRLTHGAAADYEVRTTEPLTDVPEGWLTVSAWVMSGGALDASTLALTGCGVDASTTTPITVQDGGWVRLAVSAYVTAASATAGTCTVELGTAGPGGAWASFDDVELSLGQVTRDVRGGDLSGLAKNEDFGATYADADGEPGDAVEILATNGMNLGRLKVWVDPADAYNDLEHVVATARRIEAAGMQLLVDFHYSDRWTDPGAQGVPAAWSGFTPEQLAQAVHSHTREVLDALQAVGITADYVQVGNEINPGMLWPWGQTWDVDPGDDVPDAQWDNLAAFLTAGSQAVKEVDPDTQVILHLTNINNGIGSLTWWFDEVTARSVPFDLIGLSYYGYWHGSLADLQEAVSVLSERYVRDVLVVETAYPFTLEDDEPAWQNIIDLESELVPGYPATPQGQAAYVRAVQDVVASAPGGRGIGTVYWEPAWTAVAGNGWDPEDPTSGNAWENQALFDFTGRLLPAAAEYAADPVAPDEPTLLTSRTSVRVTPAHLRTSTRPTATVRVEVPAERPGDGSRGEVPDAASGPTSDGAAVPGHRGSWGHGRTTPTGEVTVLVDGEVVATATLTSRDHGTVRVRLPRLTAGQHTVTAQYAGDDEVAGSQSEPAVVHVRR